VFTNLGRKTYQATLKVSGQALKELRPASFSLAPQSHHSGQPIPWAGYYPLAFHFQKSADGRNIPKQSQPQSVITKIQSLGHVVLRVTDLKKSEAFYNGVLGLPICARFDEQGMNITFFTLGNHHDLAISEVPEATSESSGGSVVRWLDHVAYCVGTSLDELRDARDHLEGAGVKLDPIDHEVTKSLYFDDPDGINIEFYVGASDAWKTDPQRVAQVAPLAL
jgi:catechol 2,3-dioxygenase-like lactoylglutathione lyase family enzyme